MATIYCPFCKCVLKLYVRDVEATAFTCQTCEASIKITLVSPRDERKESDR